MVFIYLIMLLDYVLTKIALNIGICYEANILMTWLVNMPVFPGILIKAAMGIVLLIPFYIIRKKNSRFYRGSVIIVLGLYLFVYVMHGIWIYTILSI